MIVAIDGPAGAGKSTIATQVAMKLGYQLIDTGAMYRTVAKKAMELDIDLTDASAVASLASQLNFAFELENGENSITCNGDKLGPEIRTAGVSEASSIVSAHPEVRQALLALQREIGRTGNAVLEGRDIGTVVFPNADVKIFLTASPKARAERRVEQMRLGGETSEFDEVYDEIVKRDRRDRTRRISPLICADDAVEVDSTETSISSVVELILSLVQDKSAQTKSAPN